MEERIESLLEQMNLEEKVAMSAGCDMWNSIGVPRLGIPSFKVTDGPSGARGEKFRDGVSAACFPCGMALGATWNPVLVERIGQALGDEARSKGAHVLLAPTVNIHRSPLAGRNFECYSEDPFLTARTAVGFIRGVQSRDVVTTVKHFACNDSEFERHTISSEVDDRALREIYLPPFEAAICEAGSLGVMSGYNKVNGAWASENPWLLRTLLKEEWGFDGFVISDWFGTNSTEPCANAGMDLEMPGPARHLGPKLLDAVKGGRVEEAIVDDMVRRLLRITITTGAIDQEKPRPEEAIDLPEHRALARECAAESMVLLKNENDVLPLDASSLKSLAVVGPNADVAVIQGGGSAQVPPHYAVRPLAGIQERAGTAIEVRYEQGCTAHKSIPTLGSRYMGPVPGHDKNGFACEYFNSLDLSGEVVLSKASRSLDLRWMGDVSAELDAGAFSARFSGTFTAPQDGRFTFSLVSAGKSRLFVEDELLIDNWTHQTQGDAFFGTGSSEVTEQVELAGGQSVALRIEYTKEGAPGIGGLKVGMMLPIADDLMERAVACAEASDAAIVVIGLNNEWETEGSDRQDMELPGRQVELIQKVAAVNPRTVVVLNAAAPIRMDWVDDVPALLDIWYTGQESGNALADVLFGDVDPSGRLPTTFPVRIEDNPAFLNYPGENGIVRYGEGVFVGYRYYDAKRIEPRFAFGAGESYARFRYGDVRVAKESVRSGEVVEVELDVTNTSSREGVEVVQLYLADLETRLARPEQELKAFHKLPLAPGERQTVRFVLDTRALSYWDPAAGDGGDWLAEPGEFEVRVGRSSRDIRARTRFTLAGES